MKRSRYERFFRKFRQRLSILWWGSCGLYPRAKWRSTGSGQFYRHVDGLNGLRPALISPDTKTDRSVYKPVICLRRELVRVFSEHIPHYLYVILVTFGLYSPFLRLHGFYWQLSDSNKIQFWIAALLALTLLQIFMGPVLSVIGGFMLYIALTARKYRG